MDLKLGFPRKTSHDDRVAKLFHRRNRMLPDLARRRLPDAVSAIPLRPIEEDKARRKIVDRTGTALNLANC
jgi:hypothetical protein